MNDKAEDFWQTQLASTDGPLIHFVPTRLFDWKSMKEVASKIGFALFVVQAEEIKSELALMNAISESTNRPPDSVTNWNVLLDVLRDLPWTKANGYIVVIAGGDNLPSLPNEGFASLVSTFEATVRDWRDERGEFGERSASVPFHVVFSGGARLKQALLGELKEPPCEHVGEVSGRGEARLQWC